MRSFILSLAILFLAGCSGPARQQTEAEKTRAITKVFETKEQYTARTLDSAAVADFLLRHPDSKGDSAAIFSFYKRRGYHYAWFAGDSLSHAAFGFATLRDNSSAWIMDSEGHYQRRRPRGRLPRVAQLRLLERLAGQ